MFSIQSTKILYKMKKKENNPYYSVKVASSKSEINKKILCESKDIFEGILTKWHSWNKILSHLFPLKAIKKKKIDDVKYFIRDVNKRSGDNSTPLMIGNKICKWNT